VRGLGIVWENVEGLGRLAIILETYQDNNFYALKEVTSKRLNPTTQINFPKPARRASLW
jgi:hypothetical protein